MRHTLRHTWRIVKFLQHTYWLTQAATDCEARIMAYVPLGAQCCICATFMPLLGLGRDWKQILHSTLASIKAEQHEWVAQLHFSNWRGPLHQDQGRKRTKDKSQWDSSKGQGIKTTEFKGTSDIFTRHGGDLMRSPHPAQEVPQWQWHRQPSTQHWMNQLCVTGKSYHFSPRFLFWQKKEKVDQKTWSKHFMRNSY